MRIERWVLPPAIAVAVFSTLAIVPPGGREAEGLHVETVTGASAVLLRVRVDSDASATPRAPATVSAVLHDAHGGRHVAVGRAAPGGRYTFVTLAAPARAFDRALLDIHADGRSVRAPWAPPSIEVPTPLRVVTEPEGEGGITLTTESGRIVPEVPERLFLRVAGGAGREATLTPTDASVHIAPERVTLDACGVGAFEVTVSGLDAHVVVHVGEREARRRLAVLAGGISVRRDDATLAATMPVGGSLAYVYAVDRFDQPLTWTAMRFDDPPDANAHASVTLPPDAAAALVSLDPTFVHAVSTMLLVPPEACTESAAAVRAAQAAALPIAPPMIHLWYDGAAVEREARAARRHRVRVLSAMLAALSLATLLAMVLRAGLRREPDAELASLDTSVRTRGAFVLAMAGALLLGGGLLLIVSALRAG